MPPPSAARPPIGAEHPRPVALLPGCGDARADERQTGQADQQQRPNQGWPTVPGALGLEWRLERQPPVGLSPVARRGLQDDQLGQAAPAGRQVGQCRQDAEHRVGLGGAGVGVQVAIAEDPQGQIGRGPQPQGAGGELFVIAQAGGVGNPALQIQEA